MAGTVDANGVLWKSTLVTHQPHLIHTTGIRFFCTGDIGQITPAGDVQII